MAFGSIYFVSFYFEQLILIDVQVLCRGLPAVQVRGLHIPQVLQPANHLPRAGRGGDALLTHLFPHLHLGELPGPPGGGGDGGPGGGVDRCLQV